jgi:hypothetical protein
MESAPQIGPTVTAILIDLRAPPDVTPFLSAGTMALLILQRPSSRQPQLARSGLTPVSRYPLWSLPNRAERLRRASLAGIRRHGKPRVIAAIIAPIKVPAMVMTSSPVSEDVD